MSNAHSNRRPRRSFTTGAAASPSSHQFAHGLKYDGEEVPVLIRLPDLSPQALLREPAANAAAAALAPTLAMRPESRPEPQQPTDVPEVEPASATHPAPIETATSETEETSVAAPSPEAGASRAEGLPAEAPEPATLPISGPEAISDSSDNDDSVAAAPRTRAIASHEKTAEPDAANNKANTNAADRSAAGNRAVASERPPRTSAASEPGASGEKGANQRRRRRRSGAEGDGDPRQRSELAKRHDARRSAGRRTGPSTTQVNQDRHILAFDKTRLAIGAGLVIAAGLTFFALNGGDDDAVQPADTWAAGNIEPGVQAVDPVTEPELDLWPADGPTPASHAAELTPQAESVADNTAPAGAATVWPAEPAAPAADTLGAESIPAADYSYNAPPITAPTNGQSYQPREYAAPSGAEQVSGWPSDSSTQVQPTSATLPVSNWPDAAMTPTEGTNATEGTPNGFYQTQAAGYTTPSATTEGYDQATSVRTGRRETPATNTSGATNATANSGSQLNGTIEIPRPRANNEYNGSSVY